MRIYWVEILEKCDMMEKIHFTHKAWEQSRAFAIAMKDFAEKLYKSRGWRETRDAYAKSVHGVCECCLRKGIMSMGEIVHHKIPITEDNIDNPEITLSWENLELLCRKCHAEAHGSRRRYKLDGFGRVIFK